MLPTRPVHLTREMLKWMILMALAGALAIVFATRAGGADDPPDSSRTSQPLLPARTSPPQAQWRAEMEVHVDLWRVLRLQREGQIDEAQAAWLQMPLPCEADRWRYLALGASYVKSGELEKAAETLHTARQLAPDNPLVYYFTGILRLEQAAVAQEWYDVRGSPRTRLVAYAPPRVVPNTRSMHQLAAMMELEQAIHLAPQLHPDEPLLVEFQPISSEVSMPATPLVHDLLVALEAEDFAAKAHGLLGQLCLERGWLEQAERHLDTASSGIRPPCGYRDLGNRYQARGRNMDAARAFLKAMKHGEGVAVPVQKVLENLQQALIDIW